MTLATGRVKTALLPANYKKNINRIRYLQKQLKICSRRKKRSTKAKTGPKTVNKQALWTANDVWLRQANCGDIFVASEGNSSQEFPTNNLFLPYETSFSTSASSCGIHNSLAQRANFQNGSARSDIIHSEQKQSVNQYIMAVPSSEMIRYQLCKTRKLSSFNQGNFYGCTFFRDHSLPVMLDDEVEQFLTGEELNQVLDIKDLFVPGRTQETETNNALMCEFNCTFDGNLYSGIQTVPSTTSFYKY